MIIKNFDDQHEVSGLNLKSHLRAGTIVTLDIDRARRFYEDFLGFECVRYAKDRLLIRDQYAKYAMDSGSNDFFVIDVRKVEKILHPQRLLHHWGVDVSSVSEVDRIHIEAKANKERYGLSKVYPVSEVHGSHSFYLTDKDNNWWEIEFRLDDMENEDFFARGNINTESWNTEFHRAPKKNVSASVVNSVVGIGHLTHGTCEQLNLKKGREFLQRVLGLRCVHHVEPAQMIAGRGGFGVFAIELPKVNPQSEENRWIITFENSEDIYRIHVEAKKAKANSEIEYVGAVIQENGWISTTIQDGDGNWWEISDRAESYYREMFARGDVS
ncbi:VOC family protein [Pseudomonas chlororaphis]|nr:VOC family protein [Pseudomonas chlororaphis]